MTDDRALLAAAHHALIAAGAGNVALARFHSSAQVTWRRDDARGHHAELTWRPARDEPAHVLITRTHGELAAHPVT